MEQDAESADPRPAPGGLAEVQAFVNTLAIEGFTPPLDRLGTAAAATAWLRRRGASLPRPLTDAERQRLVAFREGLRDLLAAHQGEPTDPAAAAGLGDVLAGIRLRPRVSEGRVILVAAGDGVDAYLGGLVEAASAATLDGTWERLKVCRSQSCRWAFYDHSKNARSAWCSMQVCGSRAKARAYRARKSRTEAG